MKKSLFVFSLGLAASLQAQEVPANVEAVPADSAAQTAVTAPAQETAVAEQSAPETAPAEATTNTTTETAPATEQVAAPIPEPAANTTTNTAASEPAPVAEQQAEQPAQEVAADSSTTQNVETAQAPTAASEAVAAPVAEVPVAQAETKTAGPLDVLHGSAYNTVGNEAAGSTITGNMAMPRKMFGTKAVYFEPISERAIVSFGDARTYFLGFDNSKELGIMTAGMSFGKIGFSVEGSLGKKWLDIENEAGEQSAINTIEGSMVGATFSMLAGPVDVAVSGRFIKPISETYIETPNSVMDPKSWSATGNATVAYSGNTICWSAGVDFLRHDFRTKAKNSYYQVVDGENKLVTIKASVSDTSSRMEATPKFNIGGAVLKAEDAKVYIGVNTSVPVIVYDEIEGISDSRVKVSANLSPNIFGEVALSKYLMAFGGASFDWNAFTYEKKELNDNTEEAKETISNKTTVNLGTRFQYNRLALEATMTKTFLQNPFAGFAKADGIMLDIGAFINF